MPKFRTGGRRSQASAGTNFAVGLGAVAPPPNPAGIPIPPTQGPPIQQQPPQSQTDDDNGIQIDDDENGAESPGLSDFRNMTDDEKAQFILDALKDRPPSFLPDNDTQRFMWHLGGDDKPTIVPDSQLDGMKGKDLYRQVAGIHDSKLGNDLNSADIANQIMTGDFTMYADGGGTAYGRAIYFGDDYSEIKNSYGRWNSNRVKGGGNDSTMLRVKVNPSAKHMDYNSMMRAMSNEVQSGSKLGKALGKIRSSDDRAVVYAISKGIDYSTSNWGYYMVYNRGCLFASSKTKHNATSSSW